METDRQHKATPQSKHRTQSKHATQEQQATQPKLSLAGRWHRPTRNNRPCRRETRGYQHMMSGAVHHLNLSLEHGNLASTACWKWDLVLELGMGTTKQAGSEDRQRSSGGDCNSNRAHGDKHDLDWGDRETSGSVTFGTAFTRADRLHKTNNHTNKRFSADHFVGIAHTTLQNN